MVDLLRRTSRLQVDDTDDTEHGSDEYSIKGENIRQEHKEYIMVAAIDLGSTYSSWAWSYNDEKKNDPTKIICRHWNDGNMLTMAAPTTILIRDDGKTVDSFGYEAEVKYVQSADDDANELHTWYYFKRFKMLLYDRKIKRDMTLESENGNVLPALSVFALTIEYLKNDLLQYVRKYSMEPLDQSLIRWILTVPSIWDESCKRFMREAAVTAGIPSNQLTLALEPEVASFYCTRIPLVSTLNGEECPLLLGAKFILIDAGGETINITAHEVLRDRSVIEVYRSNGCAWGGNAVDKEFFAFLSDVFGRSVYKNFKRKNVYDYLDLCREFERKKRIITVQSASEVRLRVPASLMSSRSKRFTGVCLRSDKMILDADIMKRFFAAVLQKTRDHLQFVFSGDAMKNVNIIVMVGGFSESEMLQEMVRNLFPTKKVIVPYEANLAVLRGAVLFGHDPEMI